MTVSETLQKAANKGGFERIRYIENNTPTTKDNIVVLITFPDMRSSYVLSSILMKRYKEEIKGSKYFILVSWPGHESLFPYVDEYWTLKDKSLLKRIYGETNGIENRSPLINTFKRELNWFFEEVLDSKDLLPFYNNGITRKFIDRFETIKCYYPQVPSASSIDKNIAQQMMLKSGKKVFVYPTLMASSWRNGSVSHVKTDINFWIELVKRLNEKNIVPLVYTNYFTHDISVNATDECIFVPEKSIAHTLAVIRNCDCVLDIHSGISRLAIAARSPFMVLDERIRFSETKEHEIDDLCSEKIPKEYIYGFSNVLENGNIHMWNINVLDNIMSKLLKFLPNLDRESLPTTTELEKIVSYDSVRKKRIKKFGTRFVKVNKD